MNFIRIICENYFDSDKTRDADDRKKTEAIFRFNIELYILLDTSSFWFHFRFKHIESTIVNIILITIDRDKRKPVVIEFFLRYNFQNKSC